jgi:hypothetical protein
MERVEIERGKIPRDRGRVALAPAGVIEDRIVDSPQPQREPENQDGAEPPVPKAVF